MLSKCIAKKAVTADLAHAGIVTWGSENQAYFKQPVTIFKLQPNRHEPDFLLQHTVALEHFLA